MENPVVQINQNKNVNAMALIKALKEAAENASDKGIGYIQGDGSLIFQPYHKLLEEAKGVLEGLRQAGLKRSDILVLAPSCKEELGVHSRRHHSRTTPFARKPFYAQPSS